MAHVHVHLLFFYKAKTHQRPSHIFRWMHRVRSAQGTLYVKRKQKGQSGSEELTGLNFSSKLRLSHRTPACPGGTGRQTRKNLIYLWLFDVFFFFIFVFLRSAIHVLRRNSVGLTTKATQERIFWKRWIPWGSVTDICSFLGHGLLSTLIFPLRINSCFDILNECFIFLYIYLKILNNVMNSMPRCSRYQVGLMGHHMTLRSSQAGCDTASRDRCSI